MILVVAWMKRHWRGLALAAVAVALYLGGVATGRRSVQVAVQRDTATHDVQKKDVDTQQTVQHVDAQATHVVNVEGPKEVIRWRIITVTAPSGEKTVTQEG